MAGEHVKSKTEKVGLEMLLKAKHDPTEKVLILQFMSSLFC